MKKLSLHTLIILIVAGAVRLLAWRILPYRDWLSDEAEYWSAATWLAQGRGFSFFDAWIWTRPPLYVLFLAVHIRMFGITALWSVRLSQVVLSVITVWLTMQIARKVAPHDRAERVAPLAGWLMALAYSFASYSYLILSETLFLTLFLAGVWLILHWAQSDHQAWRWLIAAGLVFGLATLTRAIMLTWLPFVAVWVLGQSKEQRAKSREQKFEHRAKNIEHTLEQRAKSREQRIEGYSRFKQLATWLPVIVLTLSVCVVVLPWTAYATARWGQGAGLIMVDTTGGYNFALGAQSATPTGRDEIDLHDELCGGVQCDNQHTTRQAHAYRLGWQWITQNPTGFAAKTWRELLDIVQLRFGGAERMTSGYTAGAVPLPHLAGLLLDDTLYVLALGFVGLGLFRSQQRIGKGLLVSWLAYNIAIGALIFAINRFRLPLMPFVFIYAACGMVQWRDHWTSRNKRIWAIGLTSVLLLFVLPSYLPHATPAGASRPIWTEAINTINGRMYANQCTRIEIMLRAGDIQAARQAHDALDAQVRVKNPNSTGLNCLVLVNFRLLELEGKRDQALQLAKISNPGNNPWQSARVLMTEGGMYQRMGQFKLAADRLNYRDTEIINDLDWAWEHLTVIQTDTLDLGSGFDYGYVRGFYQSEHSQPDFRWSSANSMIRFPQAGTGQAQTLSMHVRGTTMPTIMTPRINGQTLAAITLPNEWDWIEIQLPSTPAGQDVVIEFASNVFINGPHELAERVRSTTRDPLRLLGFQLDRVRLGVRD